MNLNLVGKQALVTGGTRGIGLATPRLLAGEGAMVLCTGTKPSSFPNADAENQIRFLSVDFTNPADFRLFRDSVLRQESIDILVNNAGINRIKKIEETDDGDLRALLSVNLEAPFLLCRDIIPGMKQRGFGRIVNLGSIWSVVTKSGRSMYTMAKHGLIGLTKTLAVEGAPHGVLVNAVSPGFTNTELTAASLSREEVRQLTSQIPMGRLAETEEIARVITFLCSPQNTYLTGQNVVVDGGFTHV